MAYNDLITYGAMGLASVMDKVPIHGDIDPLGVTSFYGGAYNEFEVFRQGTVITYNPQTHTASVQVIGTTTRWSCVFVDELISYSYGYSVTHPPREGDLVLAMSINPLSNYGIIVGRLPYPLDFSEGDIYNDPDFMHRRLFTQLDKTADTKIPCFVEPLLNEHDDSTHLASNFRPTDIYAGEFANVNQHNCGIKGGMFSSTLLGGGASLRLSALGNSARMTCEEYIRHTMHGSFHEFHNGRYLSSERNLALYQEERLGGEGEEAAVWTEDSEAPKEGELQTMRPRMKDLTGFFGHLSSKFCFRPDPNEGKTPRVQGRGAPKEAGVSRETIDPSGQYRLSAAGMIAIERTGRIPVPVRNCFPTDDGHDIEGYPEQLTPFEHSTDDYCYRQLELFDRQAYDLKTQYARVDGLGIDKPDYDVPQEEELSPLKDKYDEKFFGNETVKLEQFDKRRAGMYIGEDGSVIVRDAWGSEIVMMGGNITMSCAGNVMLLPGRTQLTIAGDDIVQKAQNSIDIHASEHDVRLSAARNMEIVGGGDEGAYSGGVVIESRGDSMQPWDGEKGEKARLSGITLKTNKQGVVIDGQEVHVRSRKETRILSGDKSMDGKVNIGAEMIRSRAKMIYSSSEDSTIALHEGSVYAIGESIGMYSERSFNITKGSKTPVPVQWADIGSNVASELNPKFNEVTKDLSEESTAAGIFDGESLEKMVFGFRTSEECGTDKSWNIGGKGPFKMYEPAWAQVMNIYETLVKGGVRSKEYEENANWDKGKPFPGKDAEGSAKYAKLSGAPVNLTSEGFNKSRKSVKKKSDITEDSLKDGYLIRT